MELPKTLFDLSHAKRPAIWLSKSVLVIIDAQQEYQHGKLPLTGIKEALENIQELLAKAREMGVPVIHVMHEGSPGGLFDPTTDAFKSILGLEPLSREVVVIKHLPDSFAGTTLTQELKRIGENRTLIFTGFMTHMCISATAMSALNLGYQTAVVKDAVATRNILGPNGEEMSAKEVNRSSLAALQDRISWLVDSKEITDEKNFE